MKHTIAQLRLALRYDPDTGVFWRLLGRHKNKLAGSYSQGYIVIRFDGARYPAHRVAWAFTHNKWPEAEVDHINNQRDDNRICNLRAANRGQNAANAKWRKNLTGFRGVYRNGSKFVAAIGSSNAGTRRYLGRFERAEDAHQAFLQAAAERYGEYAYSNHGD